MNVVLLTSHAIADHDDLDMFTRMGVPCYSIGGAYDEVPFEGKRPAIPGVIRYPELEAATNRQRARLNDLYGDPGSAIDWGKANLAPEVIDWADTIIVHHFPEHWIGGQWGRIRHKRVIWRTCGQSDPRLEYHMYQFKRMGMQIVRYSPKEAEAFTKAGAFAGEDALIRFGKDPAEWYGWHGSEDVVGNVTQHMAQRGDACGYPFWVEATKGLPVRPAGPGSEAIGGVGELAYDDMRQYLRDIRVYLYTGTRPASYTLGLIEAAMTGTPVVYMGPEPFGCGDLWDFWGSEGPFNDPKDAHDALARYLAKPQDDIEAVARLTRARAIKFHDIETVMAQWAEFLA